MKDPRRLCARLIDILAYPQSFEGDDGDSNPFFDGSINKIARPLSAPGSPRDRSGMMTPGDFASLQEGMEGLSTEDYIAWKLPEEEDGEDYQFPLTLRAKRGSNASAGGQLDGTSEQHAVNGGASSPDAVPLKINAGKAAA